MNAYQQTWDTELMAVLIAPNRELAEAFLATVPRVRGFQILADLRTYPTENTLDIRLRQLQPEVALIDLSTNLEQAGRLIRHLSGLPNPVHCVGLHTHNEPEVLLRAVRLGAAEFLYAPFDVAAQKEAISRLRRLRRPQEASVHESGKVILFTSAKPGSGASTLATQTAFALKRATAKRVLLADFDLSGGAVSFFLKLTHKHSVADLLEAPTLDPALWPNYTVPCGGVDILGAPETPATQAVDPGRLQEIIQMARSLYDWVVLDLPSIFHRLTLLAMPEAERAFLVSTGELPSLHLARKAIALLTQLGFGKERFQVVVNRLSKRDGLAGSDLGKLFDCPVQASFPNDYFSLHRVITLGRPLAGDCELGRAIENLAAKIAGVAEAGKKRTGAMALVGA